MARPRNQVIRNTDQTVLQRLYDEYINYIGREGKLEQGQLTIFALPRRKVRNK